MAVKDEIWVLIPKSNLEDIEKHLEHIKAITTNPDIMDEITMIENCIWVNVHDSQVVPKAVI